MLISVDTADDIGWGAFAKTLGNAEPRGHALPEPAGVAATRTSELASDRFVRWRSRTGRRIRGCRVQVPLVPDQPEDPGAQLEGDRLVPEQHSGKRNQASQSRPGTQLLAWTKNQKVEKFIGFDTTIRPSVEATMVKLVPAVIIGQMPIKTALDQVQKAQEKLPPVPSK